MKKLPITQALMQITLFCGDAYGSISQKRQLRELHHEDERKGIDASAILRTSSPYKKSKWRIDIEQELYAHITVKDLHIIIARYAQECVYKFPIHGSKDKPLPIQHAQEPIRYINSKGVVYTLQKSIEYVEPPVGLVLRGKTPHNFDPVTWDQIVKEYDSTYTALVRSDHPDQYSAMLSCYMSILANYTPSIVFIDSEEYELGLMPSTYWHASDLMPQDIVNMIMRIKDASLQRACSSCKTASHRVHPPSSRKLCQYVGHNVPFNRLLSCQFIRTYNKATEASPFKNSRPAFIDALLHIQPGITTVQLHKNMR